MAFGVRTTGIDVQLYQLGLSDLGEITSLSLNFVIYKLRL